MIHVKKVMKKVLKLLVAIILAIVILGTVMFLIDCSKIKSDKAPIFAKVTGAFEDGGTIEYTGLGYKIIDFNRLNGYDETKIGFWYIKYEDYEEEYEKMDKEIINDDSNKNNEEISGDITDEGIISGDTEIIDVPSGEVISADEVEINDKFNEIISGDNNLNSETASGDIEEGYYFNATVIGINNRNLVVQALEDEKVNASADMFSFLLPEEDNTSYLIGQKVRINYTGAIRESYPAQIDVISLEIIE